MLSFVRSVDTNRKSILNTGQVGASRKSLLVIQIYRLREDLEVMKHQANSGSLHWLN